MPNRSQTQDILYKYLRAHKENDLEDGIYDVTGIEYISCGYNSDEENQLLINTLNSNREIYIGAAYGTNQVFVFFDKKPQKLKPTKKSERLDTTFVREGSGFNYGFINILKNCPKDILILAEND